jgi:hypothetical protein
MTRHLLTAGLVAGLAVAAASPAQASSLYAVSQPGAHCHPSNQLGASYYRYEGDSLVNTGTSKWDVFIGVCPISLFVPNTKVLEVRARLRDTAKRDAWCTLYANDKVDQETYVDWSRGGYAFFSAPPYAEKGLLGATIHCLVHSGAAIEKLEVIWEVP